MRVREEVSLRVGDPSALALTLNGAAAKPVGSAGRAVTVRINRQNYNSFL